MAKNKLPEGLEACDPEFGATDDLNIGIDHGLEPTGLDECEHGNGGTRKIKSRDVSKGSE